MSCDDIDDIQQYLKSVIQSEFITYIPSKPRTFLSIISDCLHDEFDRYRYIDTENEMMVVYTMWIAIRTLMTNGGKKISFLLLNMIKNIKILFLNLLITINIMITKIMH